VVFFGGGGRGGFFLLKRGNRETNEHALALICTSISIDEAVSEKVYMAPTSSTA
jgi:hypothetical protein